eukprot:jgi/Chlat1/7503/Chrsp61S09146
MCIIETMQTATTSAAAASRDCNCSCMRLLDEALAQLEKQRKQYEESQVAMEEERKQRMQREVELAALKMELDELRQSSSMQVQLLAAVGQAVVGVDMSGRIIYWGGGAEKLYLHTREEAVGQHIVDLLSTEYNADRSQAILDQLLRGESWSGEYEVKRRDGLVVHVHVMDSPILDDSKCLTGVIGVSHDITEQKKQADAIAELNADLEQRVTERTKELQDANKELLATKNQLALVMDATEDIIFSINPLERIIKFCNKAVFKQLGYMPEELTGQNSYMIHADETRYLRLGQRISQLMAEKTETFSKVEHLELRTKSGALKWFQFLITYLYEHGCCREIISVGRDANQLKELNQNLLRASAFEAVCPDLLMQLDSDVNIKHVSPSVFDILGYDRAEVLGKSDYDFIYPEDLPRVIGIQTAITKQLNDVLDDFLLGKELSMPLSGFYKLRRLRKDGKPVWMDVNYRIVPNYRCRSYSFVTVERDITERIEQQLLRQRIAGVLCKEESNKRASSELQAVLREALGTSPSEHSTEKCAEQLGLSPNSKQPGSVQLVDSSDDEAEDPAPAQEVQDPGKKKTRRRRHRSKAKNKQVPQATEVEAESSTPTSTASGSVASSAARLNQTAAPFYPSQHATPTAPVQAPTHRAAPSTPPYHMPRYQRPLPTHAAGRVMPRAMPMGVGVPSQGFPQPMQPSYPLSANPAVYRQDPSWVPAVAHYPAAAPPYCNLSYDTPYEAPGKHWLPPAPKQFSTKEQALQAQLAQQEMRLRTLEKLVDAR